MTNQTNSADVEGVEAAIMAELKRQNLCQDKDVGKTKDKTLLGVEEGIMNVTHVAQAAIAAMAQGGWQDISTASKVNLESQMLVTDGNKIYIGRYEARTCERLVEAGEGLFKKEQYECGCWKTGWGFDWKIIHPTHWMPLPQPPQTKGDL